MKITKQFFISFLLLIFCFGENLFSQPLGSWRTLLPYKEAQMVTQSDTKIYCATLYNYYTVDKEDNSIEFFDKTTGLSDLGMSAIAFNPYNNTLVVSYTNSNIDLVKEDEIINISDIQRSPLFFDKTINHIHFSNDLAYLSTNFGIAVLDMTNNEIKDTYVIGAGGLPKKVFAVTSDGDSLYAATEEGVKSGSLDSTLLDFSKWHLHEASENLPQEQADHIVFYNGNVFCSISDTIFQYNGTTWMFFHHEENWRVVDMTVSDNSLIVSEQFDSAGTIDGRLMLVDQSFGFQFIGANNEVTYPEQAIADMNSNLIWAADPYRGLLKINGTNSEAISPNSPYSAGCQSIDIENNVVWITAGDRDASWSYLFNPNGFYRYESFFWTNFNQFSFSALSGLFDFVDVEIDPANNITYLGSYFSGLLEYDGNTFIHYDETNSALQGAQGDSNSKRIAGMELDDAGNLWIANSYATEPVVVKTFDGSWYSFPLPGAPSTGIGPMVIDLSGRKWFAARNEGLIVYDDNQSIEVPNDDQFIHLKTGIGTGNLPSNDVFSIVIDLDGQIWVGTSQGIAVFYCPEQVFDNPACIDAQQIIVETDGIAGYLLETEQVNAMAVDGANRKWIGTTNGLWLFSDDGTEEIHYFNTDNSPLLSNDIRSIAVNHATGEVFIGTSNGVIVYRGDATLGDEAQGEDVTVFPNPVMENYEGEIAIMGLVQDADVRITDISGTLIYKTKANGGMAVWNGKNYDGARAQSGVYLIFSSDETGQETYAGKILFFN